MMALWRLRSYLRPYLWRLIGMLVAACASVATALVIPLLTKALIDSAIQTGDRSLLLPIGLAATGLGIAQAALNFIRRWVQASAVTGMEQAMRRDLYAHLQRLDVGFHDEWQSGQLLSRATTDLSAIRRFAGFGTVFLITNVVTFVAVVALLIHLNWWLGLITGGIFLPVGLVCNRFERRYRVLSRRAQDQQGDLATYVEEAATGIAVLKALGRRGQAQATHGAQASLVYQTQLDKARLRGAFWATLDLIPNAVIGLIVLLGAIATSQHALTLGGLVAFITLTLELVWPIEAMGYILASGQEAATAAQRVFEILDTPPAVVSPPAPGAAARASGRGRSGGPRRGGPGRPRASTAPARLRFDRVEFRYPGTERPVLRGVTLELEPGQTLALTGATGSGKTTLLQLVPRLADPTAGSITLNGTDIRDLPLPVLRTLIGSGFEDPTLFSVSVRENVTLRGAGRHRRAGRAGPGGRPRGLRGPAALGPGHQDRRAGHGAVRRPAAAAGPGQGHPGPAARARPRRPAVRAGRAHRGEGDRRAAGRARRDDRAAGRAPAVHRAARRPGGPARRRPDRGDRHPRGTARHRAPLRRADGRRGCGRRARRLAAGGGPVTAQPWRGVAAENLEEVTGKLSALLRRRARRLLTALLRPYRRQVTWALVLVVVANLAALAGPWLVGVAIDRGIPPLVHSRDVAPLAAIMAAFFVAVAVQAITTRAFILEIGRFGEGVVAELRRRLFAHFQRLPVAFHERYTSGRVISRQTSDIDSISDLFEEGLDSLVSAVFSLLLVGVGMLLLDWPLALVVLAGFGPLVALTLWFRRESATAYRRSREAIADVIVAFVETFGGIRAVQAFRRERRNEEIFSVLNGRNAAATLRSMRLIAVYSPGITLVANLATGAVLLYGGLRVADGDIKVGVLATFLLYLQRFFDPLQDLSQFYNTFQSAGAALEKISGVLEEPLGVPEPEVPAELPPRSGAGRELWLRAVRFGYRETIVLPDMDLRIPAGQTVALVGETGAGKTTVARLVARFYDPSRAASCSTASICGICPPSGCGPRWSWSPRRTSCSPGRSRTTSSWASRVPAGRRSPRPRGRSAPMPSSTACPAVTTPTSASVAAGCPRASAS